MDLVLSGFNIGLNLGNSIWHSGTLAAAKQAALLGHARHRAQRARPASSPISSPSSRGSAAVLRACCSRVALPLVNVNFPRQPRGLVWTRASVRQYDGQIVPTKDPMGRELYWFTVTPLEGAEEGTDRWAVEQGWVSITPLRLDLTDEARLSEALADHPLDEATARAVSPGRVVARSRGIGS